MGVRNRDRFDGHGICPEIRGSLFQDPRDNSNRGTGQIPRRVGPKDLILSIAANIGADGATYQALEFTGEAITSMDMAGRMTCCNMAIEMGAKAGICPPDAVAWDYIRRVLIPLLLSSSSDTDAVYADSRQYDVNRLAPQVAVPHNVDLGVDVTKV